MAVCSKCGARVDDGATVCPNCGAPMPQGSAGDRFREEMRNIGDTAESTAEFTPDDIRENKVVSVFAYIGILFLAPLLAAGKSKFARYHTNQGLVLFLFSLVYGVATWLVRWIIGLILPPVAAVLGVIFNIASLVFLVLAVIGIVNVCNGKAKDLPVIGRIRLLK